jgi:hypothetical protein
LSSIYVIGAIDGPSHIGIGRAPEGALAKALVERKVALQIFGSHEASSSEAKLLHRVASLRLVDRPFSDDWHFVPGAEAWAAVEAAIAALRGGDEAKPGEAINALRESVFETTVEVFASIAGVSKSAVSRWVSGEQEPSWLAMSRLRQFAKAAGLPWDDSWFFQPADLGVVRANVVNISSARREKHGSR